MYQKERIEEILKILKQNGYVTVKYLTEELRYSNATVNRDLTVMERQKMVTRSYGGVELVEQKGISLPFRYHKMKSAKNKIAQKAAEFVQDGDVIFIDASTTAEYMGRYLTGKKELTVITNNMALVMFLSEYDVKAICLGGVVVEKPYMLNGDISIENVRKYHADKMFFSTGSFDQNGKVAGDNDTYFLLHRLMAENSDKVYFLADHDKINHPYTHIHMDFSEIDAIVTDYKFEENVKKKFSNVSFWEV